MSVGDRSRPGQLGEPRVLVTGAGGFLGTVISNRLRRGGHAVLGLGRTAPSSDRFRFEHMVLPSPALRDVLREWRPDFLVHAAGPASVPHSMDRPWEDFRDSVDPYCFVLDSVRRFCPRARVIFLSSAAVYGSPLELPIKESQRLNPISAYGLHKRICEELGTDYNRLFNVSICSLRIFSAYGECLKRQVVFEMLRKFHDDSDVELYGTGNESRDFIYVGDVARAVECVIKSGDYSGGVYNVASGTETRIGDLAAEVKRLVNPAAKIAFNGTIRRGDPLRWQADMTKLAALGFAPRCTLREGLRRVVRYWNSTQRWDELESEDSRSEVH